MLQMVKGIIFAPCAAALVYVVSYNFTDRFFVIWGLSAFVFFLLIYMAVFSENIYFELTSDGKLRYFKKGNLLKTFDLSKCNVGYHRRTETTVFILSSHDITLRILQDGSEEEIDCSPIGLTQFTEMFEQIEKFSANKIEVLVAGAKA
jgi:hypothetical protein